MLSILPTLAPTALFSHATSSLIDRNMAAQPLDRAILTSPILVATSLGLCLNAAFAVGTWALSNFAIQAILLRSNYTLAPPLKLVQQRQRQHKLNATPDPKISLEKPAEDDTKRQDEIRESENITPSTNAYLLRQWFYIFQKGMYSFPPMALGGCVSYLFCAYALPGPIQNNPVEIITTKRILYVIAALFSISITPFTLTALKPANQALNDWIVKVVAQEEKGEGSVRASEAQDKKETESLIQRWGTMNGYRGLLPVFAAVFAVAAMVA